MNRRDFLRRSLALLGAPALAGLATSTMTWDGATWGRVPGQHLHSGSIRLTPEDLAAGRQPGAFAAALSAEMQSLRASLLEDLDSSGYPRQNTARDRYLRRAAAGRPARRRRA